MRMPRRRFSLLAVEVDGYSPTSLEQTRDGVHDTIIVAQQPFESATEFASRLVERIERAKREGSTLVKATLACSGRSDIEAIAARILVVRTMLVANPDLGDSGVSMTSPSSSLRHQLEAIRQTFFEHGPRSVPVDETDASAQTPLQRVA
jgi:hypothetical protein